MNGKESVWEQVEAFRQQHLTGELAHLPIDVSSGSIMASVVLTHWCGQAGW
jgi:hypothetical protein